MTSSASDLRRLNKQLRVFHLDLASLESSAEELKGKTGAIKEAAERHEKADDERFRELQGEKGMAGIHQLLTHISHRLTVIQDQQIEGFRRLNARMDGLERREKNGR